MIKVVLEKKLNAAGGNMLLQVNFELKKGDLMSLHGSSGAGKTSIFRMLAGLMSPQKGKIEVNGKTWLDCSEKINLEPQKRRIGYVFQDPTLFPNMSVRKNLEYALEKKQDKSIINRLLEVMELGNLSHRPPIMLSGGQKQRVALARALVRKPEILLLDEPFSALDDIMRDKLQEYVLRVHQEFELTTLMITHDVSESIKMSNSVLILEHGKIIKQGIPIDVFSEKKLSGKFQFTGQVLEIKKEGFLYLVLILIGTNIVKIVAEEDDVKNLATGDKIIVASKAFNPIIHKIKQ
ncbi:MAG: ATP-binding cassette domain-containing protein [Psychroflexus sp.]|nr:ATP-binding cassette domain-containing protein [Psychroflexus sp.]MDN6311197.1 ATP-binding cassette domain-containing protein [Psychroflexus sp.]